MTPNHAVPQVFGPEDSRYHEYVQYLRIGRWDVQQHLPFRPEYDTWTEDQQRNYERGRFRQLGEK